jgi:hypothetical protein
MAQVQKSLADNALFLWLFPVTYLFHIAEEFWGGEGYPAYLLRTYGVHLSAERFIILQTIGMILMMLGILIARRQNFPHLLLVIFATVFLKNALIHILRSALAMEYQPGLLTSVLIWLPLGLLTLLHFGRVIRARRYVLGVAIGLAISAAIEMMTLRNF